jgi:hypothetical protein
MLIPVGRKKKCCKFDVPSDTLYRILEKCNFLTLIERLKYYSLTQMFKFLKFSSNSLHFDRVFDINLHGHSPRFINKVEVLKPYSPGTFNKCMKFRFTELWNNIPNIHRNLNISVSKYKENISKYIVGLRKDP